MYFNIVPFFDHQTSNHFLAPVSVWVQGAQTSRRLHFWFLSLDRFECIFVFWADEAGVSAAQYRTSSYLLHLESVVKTALLP